jgi:hypothetical protein
LARNSETIWSITLSGIVSPAVLDVCWCLPLAGRIGRWLDVPATALGILRGCGSNMTSAVVQFGFQPPG